MTGFTGQRFEVLKIEPSQRGTAVVYTQVINPKEAPIAINYRMRENGDGWRIIDVYLNGTVSELALRRSEYASLIQREGWNAVIAALDQRIQGFASSPADQKL
jgi:phospholipid transport system substrate-binding protein